MLNHNQSELFAFVLEETEVSPPQSAHWEGGVESKEERSGEKMVKSANIN